MVEQNTDSTNEQTDLVETGDTSMPEVLRIKIRGFPERDFYDLFYGRYIEIRDYLQKKISSEIHETHKFYSRRSIYSGPPEVEFAIDMLSSTVANNTMDAAENIWRHREIAIANGALVETIKELGPVLSTPEAVTKIFQQVWQTRGELANLEFPVSPCDHTADELRELIENGRRIGYLPEQLMGQKNRHIFYRIFPGIWDTSPSSQLDIATNTVNRFSWFDYEASIDPPYPNTPKEEALKAVIDAEGEKLGRLLEPMNLNEYIVAGNDSYLFTGKYFDQRVGKDGRYVQLLGSRAEEFSTKPPIAVSFYSCGGVFACGGLVGYLQNQVGGRSVGYK